MLTKIAKVVKSWIFDDKIILVLICKNNKQLFLVFRDK